MWRHCSTRLRRPDVDRLSDVTSALPAFDAVMGRLLGEIATRSGCRVLPSTGLPLLPVNLTLPDDVRRFYERCGGLMLFAQATFPWRVSGPHELVAASPRLLTPTLAAELAATDPTELTNSCYIIGTGGDGRATEPHIVIDLHPDRAGRCYEVFWDTYGLVGDMPIVALDVVELLARLLATDGERATLPGPHHGDAYDQ